MKVIILLLSTAIDLDGGGGGGGREVFPGDLGKNSGSFISRWWLMSCLLISDV